MHRQKSSLSTIKTGSNTEIPRLYLNNQSINSEKKTSRTSISDLEFKSAVAHNGSELNIVEQEAIKKPIYLKPIAVDSEIQEVDSYIHSPVTSRNSARFTESVYGGESIFMMKNQNRVIQPALSKTIRKLHVGGQSPVNDYLWDTKKSSLPVISPRKSDGDYAFGDRRRDSQPAKSNYSGKKLTLRNIGSISPKTTSPRELLSSYAKPATMNSKQKQKQIISIYSKFHSRNSSEFRSSSNGTIKYSSLSTNVRTNPDNSPRLEPTYSLQNKKELLFGEASGNGVIMMETLQSSRSGKRTNPFQSFTPKGEIIARLKDSYELSSTINHTPRLSSKTKKGLNKK